MLQGLTDLSNWTGQGKVSSVCLPSSNVFLANTACFTVLMHYCSYFMGDGRDVKECWDHGAIGVSVLAQRLIISIFTSQRGWWNICSLWLWKVFGQPASYQLLHCTDKNERHTISDIWKVPVGVNFNLSCRAQPKIHSKSFIWQIWTPCCLWEITSIILRVLCCCP